MERLSFRSRRTWRLLFLVIVVLPGIPFIVGSLGYVIYAFWPWDYSQVTQLEINPSSKHIILSAHGVNDSPETWSDDLQLAMSHIGIERQYVSLDWRPFSESPLLCSVVAKRIGREIGKMIVGGSDVTSVHAIGHSCGAFVAMGVCEGVKESNSDIVVQTTYLDPVSIYGGFLWRYGVDHFGVCANFSDAYIDTGDTVPGSNEAISHAHTFDVTPVRVANHPEENPHNWPAKFYVNAVINSDVPLLSGGARDLNRLYPKGTLTQVHK